MKQTLLLILSCILLPLLGHAQVYPGGHRFNVDSLYFTGGDSVPHLVVPDTSATPLWQIGHTTKMVFAADTTGSHGIMTDTVNHYPVNANNYFTIAINSAPTNMIIDFWHEYQTDSGKDGGIIEFSTDTGATWLNIAYCPSSFPGIITKNVYTYADSLTSGQQAFSGNSHGQVHSMLQFYDCIGVKTTATTCHFAYYVSRPIYIRFRFVSDTLADTLSGWKIDSVKIAGADCGGLVNYLNAPLHIAPYPNPTHDGVFNFPALDDEKIYSLEIYNALGAKVYSGSYQHQLNLSGQTPGLYFFTVHSPQQRYSGKLNYF